MTTVNSGNDEFDFRLIFGEDGPQPGLGPADTEPDDSASFHIFNEGNLQSSINQPIGILHHETQTHPTAFSSPHRLQTSNIQESKYSPVGAPKAFECPSIQITSISPSCQQGIGPNEEVHANGTDNDYMERPSRDHLYLPLDPVYYRDASLSPSPASSISSRSWFSDASSCESFSHVYDDVDSELNEAAARFTLGSPSGSPRCCPADETWQPNYSFAQSLSPRQSPCHSPRASITDENWLSPRPTSRPSSRPTSPWGKRRHSSAEICYAGSLSPHHSPTPSPGHSPRGSVTEDTWLGNTALQGASSLSPGLIPFQCCPPETDIPLKSRKTSQDQAATVSGKVDLTSDDQGSLSPSVESPVDDLSGSPHPLKKDLSSEQFLSVPSHFTWNKPKPGGHTPIFRTSSLPSLDWPLPSQYLQYELKIEVQPKTHHRAHYETEGSRGAVKASSGGHPVVKLQGYNEKPINLQMFIGTADDRYLRPHAFYQVHRITGKTVATASQEIIVTSTKVLEIPLLPENNMTASIDCAGILKLRNSDIELRKGETDIGRKNTRVRLVFRVHIPQPNGKVVSLQAASIPVECSQRSAQELPQIEKYSTNSCSVSGGEEMIVNGFNFLPESKIVFLEKGPDGRPQWEVEGKIVREKSQGVNLVVEVPPYHNKSVTSAVQVQFYVCNGKRKRSQSQRFTYLPVLIKREHTDERELPTIPTLPMSVAHTTSLHQVASQLPSSDTGHLHENLTPTSQRNLGPPMQQSYPPMISPSATCMPHLLGRSISPGSECSILPPLSHQSFPTPAPPIRPSYQPMQSNMMYNGQPGLPMNSVSSQRYEKLSYQPDVAGPLQINLGCQQMQQMYCSPNPGTASSPSPTTAHSLGHSPRSGQTSSPLQSSSLGSLPAPPPLTHHSVCDPSSFSAPERASLNIKQEPEDSELPFQAIGLQDITLDDVNEIIGRDMSQIPTSRTAAVHVQSQCVCPGALESGIPEGV
ncbi:nuclear factor of activated T-cells, cytoplasmic 3 isoform X1 [Rhincodon typus]|uniref:nuclear factor of activated T-cells, cytoplasmic 3 isoform X1 n=1 Tax=Rhincodon typus TaxID=259920 RepID=UPI00202E5C51|nr:nuclear factor of activated T-cells, cytoplasmic 3 isoform X1 [Rhincodon typus]